MKPLLFAAAVLLTPAAAQAQVAAGTLPNTFDRPAAQAPARTPAPAAAPAPDATDSLSPNRVSANSEPTLRAMIASIQAGAVDYALMSDDLASKVREQETSVTPLVRSFGAMQAMNFMGSQGGADFYGVTFANAATEWVIGFNEDGKIAALLFRPAEN
jgi:hypothetical protein